jgi:wyosine [tRNA(Phe)-imidazoG37] synthetase (radical SAM superfamily)
MRAGETMSDFPRAIRYVFGPVPSRRLGRSLGVDLVTRKVCTMDCVYCQVGRTTRKTLDRERFAPVQAILDEIREKLRAGPRPDYVTLSGSGEPTLNADLGEIIAGIKSLTDVPVAIITNGSLLFREEVRRDCARADLVLPSLDACDEETFRLVNRPEPSLTFNKLLEGLIAFRSEYTGPIWLEVFLVRGVNDSEPQLARLQELIARIRPDRVQLNTAVRPTAELDVRPLTESEMNAAAKALGPNAEVIADFRKAADSEEFAAGEQEVLDMIRRRPVTVDDIAAGMGLHQSEAAKRVGRLLSQHLILRERRGDKDYFRPAG